MKISIITVTYNSGKTLRDTILSVLNQDYQNYEHIIIDGGSKDNTLDIIREFESRYKGKLKWISEPDKGIYDAMNKGIAIASGDIVGILNSDDFYADSHVLEKIVGGFEGVEVVYGDLVFVDSLNTDKIVREWKGSQYKSGGFMKGWHPAHPTFYASKRLFMEYGDFDLSFDVSADFELMFRFLEKARVKSHYIPYTLVKMRIGGESTGSIKKIIQGNKNVLRAFRKNGYKVPSFYLIRRLFPKALNIVKNKLHIKR